MGTSAWAEDTPKDKVAEAEEVIATEAAADVDLGNLKSDDENVDKKVDENVEETENGVSASASASVSYKFDYGQKFEEYLAMWREAIKQKEENNEENFAVEA